MILKQKLQTTVPTSISIATGWLLGVNVESEIKIKFKIDKDQKCVFSCYSYSLEEVWKVNKNKKFNKIIVLSTHNVISSKGEIKLEGGEYIMLPPDYCSINFIPSSSDSSLLVFCFYEKNKKMRDTLKDLMS